MSQESISQPSRNTLTYIISQLFLIVISATVITSLLFLVLSGLGIDTNNLPAVTETVIFQSLMIVFYLLLSQQFDQQVMNREKNPELGYSWGIKTWYKGWAMVIVLSLVVSLVFAQFSDATTQSVYEGLFQPESIILVIFTAAILAPIAEELVFRKYLMDRMEMVTTPMITLMLSALLFSSVHWLSDLIFSTIDFTISHMLSTLLLGILLGYVYQQSGDIKVPIVLHMISNGIPFIALAYLSQYPVTDEQLNQYLAGDTSNLSDQVIENITINIAVNAIYLIIIVIGIIWAIIAFLRNRSRYWNGFKNGLRSFTEIFTTPYLFAVIIGILGFVGIPFIIYQVIPSSPELLGVLRLPIANLMIVGFAAITIRSNSSDENN